MHQIDACWFDFIILIWKHIAPWPLDILTKIVSFISQRDNSLSRTYFLQTFFSLFQLHNSVSDDEEIMNDSPTTDS